MFTKSQFLNFRKEVENALSDIAKKYEVDIHCGNIKYTDAKFDMGITVSKKEVNGKSFEQAEFEKNARVFGMDGSYYGKMFTYGGNTYKVVGINTRAHTMPIIAERDGKRFKFGTEVKALIRL